MSSSIRSFQLLWFTALISAKLSAWKGWDELDDGPDDGPDGLHPGQGPPFQAQQGKRKKTK